MASLQMHECSRSRRGRLSACLSAALTVLALGIPLPGRQAEGQGHFQGCAEKYPGKGYDYYFCFYETAQERNLWKEAFERLEHLARTSGFAWIALGHIKAYGPSQDLIGAQDCYIQAADQLSKEGEADGEVLALSNAYENIYQQDSLGTGYSQDLVDRALQAGEKEAGSLAQARAWTLQARSLLLEGGDLGHADGLLRNAEPEVFNHDDYRLKLHFLNVLGSILNGMGRFAESQRTYRRLVQLADSHGDDRNRATAMYNLAAALMSELEDLPEPDRRDEVLALAQQAVHVAERVKRYKTAIKAHLMIAGILDGDPGRRREARKHYRQAIQMGRIWDSSMLSVAQWGLAWSLVKEGRPDEARRIIAQARSEQDRSQEFSTFAGRTRLLCNWALEDLDSAIQVSRAVLGGVEGLRGTQADASSRQGLFSTWTSYYYLFSGLLLNQQPLTRELLETAFQVTEQMRARVLLEALSAGMAPARASSELDRIDQAIARINRQLRTGVSRQQKRGLRAELRRLELEEAHLRSQAFQESLLEIQARKDFASLSQVEARLNADEALLSFQVGLREDLYGDFGGGSWLLASTQEGTRTYRLKGDRLWLQRGMPLFLGLIKRRDGMESRSAASIYARILQQALEGLPSRVSKLIIVPDGALHRLPFGLLPLPQGLALAQRYQVSIVPSATLWLKWKEKQPNGTKIPALAIADPDLPSVPASEPTDASRRRDWTVEPLLPLPNARQEGNRLVEQLGGQGRLVVGANASEQFIKSDDLRQYALMHFAAHAVVDDEFPERSSVMLAPGSEQEDGRLQMREIVDLDLDGLIIVLAACRSASGTVLSGEGVIGLARAFFQAGARSVVGSLWPLRDDDAKGFFEAFYAHLSQGNSIASALNAAQKDRIEQGEPAQAWAGLVVLGDGNYIPFPGGLPQASPMTSSLFALAAALATAAALAAFLILRSRKRRGLRLSP